MLLDLGKFSKRGKNVILEQLDNGCMRCISHCRDKDGYVRIYYNNKQNRLYRVIYEKKFGPIPSGMLIRHKCDNTYCCNIDHLIIGTPKDNVADMWERNRQRDFTKNLCIGYKNGANKLTETQVKEIYLSSIPYKKLAKMYNVSSTNIYYIKHKLSWKWFTDKLD